MHAGVKLGGHVMAVRACRGYDDVMLEQTGGRRPVVGVVIRGQHAEARGSVWRWVQSKCRAWGVFMQESKVGKVTWAT